MMIYQKFKKPHVAKIKRGNAAIIKLLCSHVAEPNKHMNKTYAIIKYIFFIRMVFVIVFNSGILRFLVRVVLLFFFEVN